MKEKLKTIGLWVSQTVLAAPFVAPGWMKVTSHPGFVQMFRRYGYPDGFYFVVGVMELAGAAGLLVPRFTTYAAGVLMVVMAGATVTHLVAHEVGRAVFTGVLFLLLGLLAYARRPEWLRRRLAGRQAHRDSPPPGSPFDPPASTTRPNHPTAGGV